VIPKPPNSNNQVQIQLILVSGRVKKVTNAGLLTLVFSVQSLNLMNLINDGNLQIKYDDSYILNHTVSSRSSDSIDIQLNQSQFNKVRFS
jgi:hypothetical protein